MTDPQGNPTPPAVAALQKNLASLIEESQALRTDMSKGQEIERRRNAAVASAIGVLIIMVGLLCVLAWQGNRMTHQNADVLTSVQQTNDLVAGCTTPGGKCNQEGRARTSQVLADVIRAQIFVAQCARLWPNEAGPDYDRKLQNCVYERLADAAKASPAPSPASSPSPRG